jgi:methyl-accepting chemotaxis protein
LRAKVALEARLANLLHLSAGADASIESVKLTIKGVQARAALIVRLDNVKAIIDRTLQTLDNNPQIITQLTGTLDNTVNTVGGVANNAVTTVGDLTRDVLRSGAVLDLARGGLTTVNQTVNAAGQTVRQVRDRSGGLYRVITDTAGRIVSSTKL